VELGVSDVEPAKFVGDNWPGGFFGSAPTAAQLNNITSIVPVVGQVFAIYTSANVGASPLNLSRAGIAAILQGSATNWNQVPLADGSGFVNSNLPIKICNRDKGSGTRAGAGFFFNDYGCSASGAPLATTGALAINASTGTELTCISGAPATEGRIGYAVVQNAVPAGTSIANINGVAPSVTNAANGTYPYWYEATFNHGTNLTGNDLTLSNVLAARVQNTAVLPSPNPNLLPLADYNTPTLAISATAPVAITTHSGGSCNVPATVF
jgi:ABC-type phosphate transport system substrate-binding protein